MLGMMNPNKKVATLILNKGGEVKQAPDVMTDADPGLDAAADKFFKALEAKDKAMLIDALKDAFTMIAAEEEGMESLPEVSMEG